MSFSRRLPSGVSPFPILTSNWGLRNARRDYCGGLIAPQGPGNDWRCTVYWTVPGSTVTAQAVYQLNVSANGRYIADGDGPAQVNGYFLIVTDGTAVPNPLWQFDGDVDLLPGH